MVQGWQGKDAVNTMTLLLCIFFRLVVLKIVFSTKKILDSAGFIF